jgi:putative transposase
MLADVAAGVIDTFPRQSLARPLRFVAPHIPQHVVLRGNNKSIVFVEHADYSYFREALQVACVRYGCEVHAYVLMTNHVHLLVTPSTPCGIPRVMQSVGRRYVRRFNEIYGRSGHLWGGRYRAIAVETERYLFTCYRYIELNPVRAALVTDPHDYPWSSHRANAFGITDSLVTHHERYTGLGRDRPSQQFAYRALFSEAISESTLAEIRNATNKTWALGSRRFRDEVAAHLARRTQSSPQMAPA